MTSGRTPLLGAVVEGPAETVAALLAKGADVNVRNNDGATPLDLAAYEGRADVVELLVAAGAESRGEGHRRRSLHPLRGPAWSC